MTDMAGTTGTTGATGTTSKEPTDSSIPWIHIKPHHWGPYAWTTLHFWTFGFPEVATHDDIYNYSQFMHMFGKTIPCHSCRHHFQQLLALYPPEQYMKSRSEFIRWGIDMHNRVNKRLNKPELTEKHVVSMYSQLTAIDETSLKKRVLRKNPSPVPEWLAWALVVAGLGGYVLTKK